jgi:hypothetical protein
MWRSRSTQQPGRHPVRFVVLMGVGLDAFAFSAPKSRVGRFLSMGERLPSGRRS